MAMHSAFGGVWVWVFKCVLYVCVFSVVASPLRQHSGTLMLKHIYVHIFPFPYSFIDFRMNRAPVCVCVFMYVCVCLCANVAVLTNHRLPSDSCLVSLAPPKICVAANTPAQQQLQQQQQQQQCIKRAQVSFLV